MTDTVKIDEPTFIQKWGGVLAGVALLFLMTLYLGKFGPSLSEDQAVWGQFGDYVGGLVNPIVGLLTIILLTVSLRQSHAALVQSNLALAQSRVEIQETRRSIEQTEKALNAQLQIAAHARDMNNAITMLGMIHANFNTHREIAITEEIAFEKEPERDRRRYDNAVGNMRSMEVDMGVLEPIMKMELHRLRKLYVNQL